MIFVFAIFSVAGSYYFTQHRLKNAWYLEGIVQHLEGGAMLMYLLKTLVGFFILYCNLVPISLPVTLEMIRFFQASYINQVMWL
jgi:magnesium-transporting ATPase (P-type)